MIKNRHHTLPTIVFCLLIILAAQQNSHRTYGQTQKAIDDEPSTAKPAGDLPQLTLQLGHSGMVNAVAFSSDGRFVLTGSAAGVTDNSIVLWVTATGREVRRFNPEYGAKSIAFLPGGYLFLTVTDDGDRNTMLWNAETGQVIHDFGDDSPKFSPDGRLLLTEKADEVIAWTAATGKVFKKFRAPKAVSKVSFSPNGQYAVIETDAGVLLWDIEKDKEYGRFAGISAKFSADGPLVVTTLKQESVLWNAATHREVKRFRGAALEISRDGRFLVTEDSKQTALWDLVTNRVPRLFAGTAAQLSPDRRLVSTEDSGELVIWNALTGEELHRFRSAIDGVTDIRFSSDGRFFLTEGNENKGTMPALWDAHKVQRTRELPSFDSTSAAFSPDNRFVLTGGRDKFACLWDAATGLEVRRFEGLATNTSWLDFPAGGRFFQINSIHRSGDIMDSMAAHLWNLSSGQEVRRFEALPDTANSAAISADGKLAATGGEKTAHLWNIASAAEIRTFAGHTGRITSITFSSDGRFLATASDDGTARLWDASSGKLLQRLIGHRDKLSAVRFSHNGRFLLTGGADGTARLWSANTGGEVRRYGEKAGVVLSAIGSVAFSPDDRYVLAGGWETNDLAEGSSVDILGFARIWDTKTGRELKRFEHATPVTSVAFSPDGLSVLTVSQDAIPRIWNIKKSENMKSMEKEGAGGLFADYSPDGRFILTGGLAAENPEGRASIGARAFLWNAATGEPVRNFASGSPDDLMPFFAALNAGFSSDGRFLITQGMKVIPAGHEEDEDSPAPTGGASQALAQVWEVATGKEIARFGRHNGDPATIKFSPDTNSILVSRLNRRSVDVLDAFSGKVTNVIAGPSGAVSDLTYSPDGGLIAGASEEGATYLWDARTRTLVHRFEDDTSGSSGWNSAIGSVMFMVGGLNGVVFVDGKIFMTETSSGSAVEILQQSPTGQSPNLKSTCVAFSSKEAVTSIGGLDGTVYLARLGADYDWTTLSGHTGAITSLIFSPGGRALASASLDKTVRLWDVSTRKQLQLLQHLEPVTAVLFSTDDHLVLTASGASAWLWDAATGKQLRELRDPSGVSAISFVGKSGRILTGSQDGTLRMWDQTSGAELQSFRGHTGKINSIAITSDGKSIVSGSADKTVRLWDVTKAVELRRFVGHTDAVTTLAISSDGRDLMTGSTDQTIRVWDVQKGIEVGRIAKRFGAVASVTFSHDGHFLLTGSTSVGSPDSSGDPSFTGVARLWDIRTMELVRSFGTEPVIYTAFSADDKYILTATGARSAGGLTGIGNVRIWEIANVKNVKNLEFEGYVSSVAFSPDGQSILTGTPFRDPREDPTIATGANQDNEAVLTKVDHEEDDEGRKFVGHTFPVNRVAFSPDGRFIVTGSMDGTSAFWDTATQQQLCRVIPLRDGNWVVVDKEGRFDTNNLEEIKGLHWVFSDDPMRPLPLEIYMRDYYEPRLLPSLLNRKALEKIKPLNSLNRVQPIVKITKIDRPKVGPESHLMVTIAVADATGDQVHEGKRITLHSGVDDLRLFRDGQLVGHVPGNLKLDDKGNATVVLPVKLRRDQRNENVEFTAYAFNVDRVKSAAAAYTYEPRQSGPAIKGRAYIISVGVNAYEDKSLNLSFAANDAQLSAEMLTRKLSATGLYSEVIPISLASDHAKTTGDSAVTAKLATKQNFHAVLDALAHGLSRTEANAIGQIPGADKLRKVEPEDLVLITFSSHGYTDRQGKFYLIPYDTGPALEFLPGGDIAPSSLSHFISSDELSQWFQEIDAGELALIVDTCHSAAAVEEPGFKPGPMGSRGMGQLAYDKGMRILAASQADDVALELNQLQHGLLTYALMEEGLNQRKADQNADGRITLAEWMAYGAERVPTLYDDVITGKVDKLKRDVQITSLLSASPMKQNAFQQPQLFDFKRKSREVRLQ